MQTPKIKILGPDERSYDLAEFTTVGSDPSSSLHLAHPSISERHARIEKKDQGYIIRDMRSATGTFVNDVRILEGLLQHGDIIRIGEFEFRFELGQKKRKKFPMSSRNELWNEELQSLGNIAQTDFPILILGPSGTGKDVIAQEVHKASPRTGPIVSVNCSALTETLIESELFGHLKGSFTGAIADRKGAFEAARGGTLFLDEIGDLSYTLQAKLLRALENNEIRPVGSDKNVKTDVRIIAATHQNLSQKIQEGLFRADLYFRLNVVTITPPALKQRMEDFDDLLYQFAKQMRVRFSYSAIDRLKKHPWPGNIRELKNLVSRACAVFPGVHIQEEHIEKLIDRNMISPLEQESMHRNLPVIKEIERQMIIKRLSANHGNQRRTARDLGIPKSTLHDRLRSYEIDIKQFRTV